MTKLYSFIGGFVTAVLGSMLSGPAPLIAAMRAYVVSRFGAEVEL